MIYNKGYKESDLRYDEFAEFVKKNLDQFMTPYNVPDIDEYIMKLYTIGTIAYERNENNQIIAILVGYTDNTPDNNSYLTMGVVDNKYRNKGYIKKLMSYMEEVCIEKNLKGMWLVTEEENIAAVTAYEKYGFVKDGYSDKGLLVFRKTFDL